MPTAAETLDARALEVDRRLQEIIASAPLGGTIRLPQLGVTIEVMATEAETVRVGIVAPRDAVIRRPEPSPPPPADDAPEFDLEEFARGAGHYVPPQAMLDEDWSDHAPAK